MNENKKTRSVNALLWLKRELFVLVYSDHIMKDTSYGKKSDALFFKADKLERRLINDFPMYKRIHKKHLDADKGDYFEKVEFSSTEKEFMKINPVYLQYSALIERSMKLSDVFAKKLKYLIRTGKAEKNIMDKFEYCEMKIWKDGERFSDQLKDTVVFTFDSTFYEILNGDWGTLGEKFLGKLDEKLKEFGCSYERYDYSTIYITEL